MSFKLIRHANTETLIEHLASSMAEDIDRALTLQGRALLALAGGRTSPPVFRRLAAQSRAWSKVHVVPSDERWVNHDHPDCNLRQMQDAFVGAEGIRWLSLTPLQCDGPVNADFGEASMRAHPEAFDLTMVGMGVDGHFASLFPGAPTLPHALDLHHTKCCIAIEPNPMPAAGPHQRVSLTLSRLLRSDRILLVITGTDKLAVLERAQHGDHSLPVSALLAAHHPAAEIHWSP
ncbi:6-phosphogluconolactonase [Ahniella affigens]|uniref:6-phosphogluconolactonase n=1 Tax=Ahniella affigens TaxID=2021234 RepID=A0A2P1PMM3_9GAMM|nr:6-phosphogluconolactonase [Ahniella affigens]AVP96086.1 6-phosphogluconolactonase [Ahniella affigens]